MQWLSRVLECWSCKYFSISNTFAHCPGFANQEESAKPSGKFGFNFDAEKDGAAPDKNPITSPTDNVDPPESNGNTEATANATK